MARQMRPAAHATGAGAYPHIPVPIFFDEIDFVAADAVRIGGVVAQVFKRLGLRVENIDAGVGADPNLAIRCFANGGGQVVAQTFRIVLVVLVFFEVLPVEAVQAVEGGEPHETFPILNEAFQPIRAII